MIITQVKFYQGVSINGEVITHARNNAPELGTTYTGVKSLQIEEVENGILLKKGNLATLATWNNVQYVEYNLENEKSSKTK